MVIDKKDFYIVDSLYQACFGESSIPTETQLKWFLEQPEGIICLRNSKEIIGALSYWFITDSDFQNLSSGKIKESQLKVTSTTLNDTTNQKIYISEIALKTNYRGQRNSLSLLIDLISQLEVKFAGGEMVLLALGYSKQGQNLLIHLGFKEILSSEQTADKQPLYQLKIIDKLSFHQLKEQLIKASNKH